MCKRTDSSVAAGGNHRMAVGSERKSGCMPAIAAWVPGASIYLSVGHCRWYHFSGFGLYSWITCHAQTDQWNLVGGYYLLLSIGWWEPALTSFMPACGITCVSNSMELTHKPGCFKKTKIKHHESASRNRELLAKKEKGDVLPHQRLGVPRSWVPNNFDSSSHNSNK